MPISFIVFVLIGFIIVAVGAYRLGAHFSHAAKREQPEEKNSIPYDKCVAGNTSKFQYGSLTDARDGETYRTIRIGNQVWMAENLRFHAEGSFAPNNHEENVKVYGRLYTWNSALGLPDEPPEDSTASHLDMTKQIREKNYQGIAPEGWHIPSNKEWETLMSNFPEESSGIELRAECCWQRPGEDSVGFFALPAGYRFDNGTYCQFGKRARFWSKDEYGKSNAYRLSLTENSMDIEGVYRSDAISVRCVKNA